MQVRQCGLGLCKFDKPFAMLHPIPVSDIRKKIGINLIKLPQSRNGNHYCITLTDYFSKWPEAEAIPTKEARHVANFLYKMIFRHGFPEKLYPTKVLSSVTSSLTSWRSSLALTTK